MPPTLRALKHRGPVNTSSDSFVSTLTSMDPSSIPEEKGSKANVETHQSVKAPKKRKTFKRIKYQKASFSLRAKLVQMVDNEGYSIRQAAKKLQLKYSTAKCIYKLFVEESRLGTTRVSKDSILNTSVDKDGNSKSESEEQDTDTEQRKTLTAGIKKIKRDCESTASTKKIMEEERLLLKQEYDHSLESQNKEASCPLSEKIREKSLQSDTVQSDSTGTNSPVNKPKLINSNVEALKPEIITYIPQIYQNCLILIPVKVQGNTENRFGNLEPKLSLFAPSQQQLQPNLTNCHPSVSFQANTNPAFMGFSLANHLRAGMHIS